MIGPFQTEAFDSRQSGDDDIGLVGSAGPVVTVKLKTCSTCTGEQTLRPRQAELLARAHIVGAAVGCTCRGWIRKEKTV